MDEKLNEQQDTFIEEEEKVLEKEDQQERITIEEKKEAVPELEELLITLEGEKKEKERLQEKALRLQADFENHKRRVFKERERVQHQANRSLVEGLLPIIDNLERAISSKPQDELAQGVKMILNQLLDYLSKEGLEEINALNQPFDPCYHEAVEKVEGEDCKEDMVVLVLQKGYCFKGELLRAAVVKVMG